MLKTYKNEKSDFVKLEGRSLSFRFDTDNHVDGIDFKVGCAESLRFALAAEARTWPVARIRLGATGGAKSNPFTLHRKL